MHGAAFPNEKMSQAITESPMTAVTFPPPQNAPVRRNPSTISTILRWVARISSLGTFAIIGAFAFGEGTPTAKEWLILLVFPIGLLIGLLIGWWRDILGGAIAISSVAILYIIILARGSTTPGPYFALLAVPGVLFLASGLLARRH